MEKKDYWSTVVDTRRFGSGLCRIPRNYYLGIAKHYLPDNFLDLGCGYGDTYNLFKKNGVDIDYTGTDITSDFIKICERRYPYANWAEGSIEDIEFPDGYFDMVTCRAVLEHLPDPEPAIREMARVSNEVVVIVWFRHPGEVDKRSYKAAGYWDNQYSREDILEIVASAGLELEEELHKDRHLVWILEKK